MPLLGFLLLLHAPADAGRCGADATARVHAAEDLFDEAYEAPPIDKAALIERTLILLERTLEDEPDCKAAQKLLKRADAVQGDMEALSTGAAREQAVLDARDRLEIYEEEGVADPEAVQALRFQLKALSQILPEDERILALMTRAAALQVQP